MELSLVLLGAGFAVGSRAAPNGHPGAVGSTADYYEGALLSARARRRALPEGLAKYQEAHSEFDFKPFEPGPEVRRWHRNDFPAAVKFEKVSSDEKKCACRFEANLSAAADASHRRFAASIETRCEGACTYGR